MAAISFHHTKNISCGEGGALLINDRNLVRDSVFIRDKGTNRSEFLKDHVGKYEWQRLGSSYLLGDLSAALSAAIMMGIVAILTNIVGLLLSYLISGDTTYSSTRQRDSRK